MLKLPKGQHRSLLLLMDRIRLVADSIPSVVVAGNTFLLLVDRHSIPRAVAHRPSLDCKVVDMVLVVHIGLVCHHRNHFVVDRERFGFAAAAAIQWPLSHRHHCRSELAEDM